jgi:hypothetical protein
LQEDSADIKPWSKERIKIVEPSTNSVKRLEDAIDVALEVDVPAALHEDVLLIGIDGSRSKQGGDGDWSNDYPPTPYRFDRQIQFSLAEVGTGFFRVGTVVRDYALKLSSRGIRNQRVDVLAQWISRRPDAPTDGILKFDRVPILFDDEPPQIDSIRLDPSGQIEIETPLKLFIEANDALSGVKDVFWALDEKTPNGKLDKAEKDEPKPAERVSNEGVWLAEIETKDIKPNPVANRVFVWTVDQAGNESRPRLQEFKLVRPMKPKNAAAAKLGSIRGKVVLDESGGSPKFDQVMVFLNENKPNGVEKRREKANSEGVFQFKDVSLGSYVIHATGPVIGTTKEGSREVVLEPNADDPSKPPVANVTVPIGRKKPPMTPPKST